MLAEQPVDTDRARSRWVGFIHPILLPLLGYVAVGLVSTWPLVTRLQGWVPGSGDWGQNMWALWWTRKALLVLQQSPFFTHYLFHPEGVTLLFHPLDVTDGLLALPLFGLVGGDVSYNLVVIFSFVMSGWGAYLLVLHLTQNRWAALAGGLVFATSPYHALRLELGHLNLASTQWIPFYTLCLLKYVREGRSRYGGLAVLFLVLNALCSWYYVVACGLMTLATATLCLVCPIRPIRLLLRPTVVLVAAALVLAPLLAAMFGTLSQTEIVGEHNPLRHSVDALSFWIPGPPSSWASWFESIWAPYAAQNREPGSSAYLGYSVLILSGAGLAIGRRRFECRWWLCLGMLFAVLSLGPFLQVGGRILDVKLPYEYLLRYAPGFSVTGVPGRFVVMVSLATAAMAGFGLSALVEQYGRFAPLVAVPFLLVIALEFVTVPIAGSETRLPEVYQRLAADEDAYAVLDVKWDANYLMHAQITHDKPLVGGWLARLPGEQARYLDQGSLEEAVTYLLVQGSTANDRPRTTRDELLEGLARHQVRYIIDHDDVLRRWIVEVVGWEPVRTEEGPERIVMYAATP